MKKLLIAAGLMLQFCLPSLADEATLFERIGGEAVLRPVVDDYIDLAANNVKTKRTFKGIKLETIKESVYRQFCMLTGGGCEYEGETMYNAHADAKITEAEFDSFVHELRVVLDSHGVGTREKNELLKILAPMKRDIVYNPKRQR